MPATEAPRAAATGFECIIPILRVQNLSTSVDYYVKAIGFTVDWLDPGAMASVSRDGRGLMLCEGSQGNPETWVWIGVEDIEALFDEYRESGATVRLAPTNYPWAYEMQIADPDGHVLRFGSDPRTDLPFA